MSLGFKSSNSKKSKKKSKVKKIWVAKKKYLNVVMTSNFKSKNIEEKFVSQIRNDEEVRSWRSEKKFHCWYNVMFGKFSIPTKEPRSLWYSQKCDTGSLLFKPYFLKEKELTRHFLQFSFSSGIFFSFLLL